MRQSQNRDAKRQERAEDAVSGALPALPEDPSSVPSSLVGQRYVGPRASDTLSLPEVTSAHTHKYMILLFKSRKDCVPASHGRALACVPGKRKEQAVKAGLPQLSASKDLDSMGSVRH